MSETFAERLLDWQLVHGRHDLPWQNPRHPYRVWVSEIMLQQTQVGTVIPYFLRFMERFPDVRALAGAALEDVNRCWAGLGYYRRARFLHQAANTIVRDFDAQWPRTESAWASLPGIGRSTAAAIVSQAYDVPAAILDGNVKRVLCRLHALAGDPGSSSVTDRLWALAVSLLPNRDGARYTQASMDLGATVCLPRGPRCESCPVQELCLARQRGIAELLPTRVAKKAIPTRHTCWLVMTDQAGRIALCQRPPTGVWPALWCLPEADSKDALARAWQQAPSALAESATVRHTFTHFRLVARVFRACATHGHAVDGVDGAGQSWAVHDRASIWVDLQDSALPAMPAPVRKLLLSTTP